MSKRKYNYTVTYNCGCMDDIDVGDSVQIFFESSNNDFELTADVVDVDDVETVTVELDEDELPEDWPDGFADEMQIKEFNGLMARLWSDKHETWINARKIDGFELIDVEV